MDHKYGKCTRRREEPGVEILQFCGCFNKTIISLALVRYEKVDIQLGAAPFLGYLPPHIQRALIKKTLNISNLETVYQLKKKTDIRTNDLE